MTANPTGSLRLSIKTKIALLIFYSVFITTSVGIGLGYFWGKKVIYGTIGKENRNFVELYSRGITSSILAETEDVIAYFNDPVWEDAIRNSNAAVHYNTSLLNNPQDEAMSHSEEHSAELVKKLSTYVSHEEFLDFAILFDRNFNIVAHSSGWTGCYKDEELLNEAKSAGGDALLKIVAGADNTPLIPISIKIRDEDDQPIGTSIVFFNLEKVLASVGISRIETDGFFVVTDAERIVLFSPGVKPFSKKFLSYNQFEKLVSSDDGYIMANIDKNRGDKKIVIMSTVSIGAISSENESLMVFFELDASRAFNPLRQLVSYLFLICLILGIIIVPMGQIAGNAFISPINKLRWATDEVLAGNWDHQIKIKTGDEIQLLSEAFNEMILRIKVKQDQLVTANQALADFSINLEKKVEERTTELSKTHEAMLNLLEDLTEAKLNLEKVLKIKSDFTAMVSHELRTPLAAIKEGIAIVSDGTTGELNPRQKEFLDIARKNVDRLSRLINSILDFQRLESGKLHFHIIDNDINEIVVDVHNTMSSLARDKGLEFRLSLGKDIGRVKFDRDRIIQVLTNLVNNAIKFTDHGWIEVTTVREEDKVKVSVSDSGLGIRKEDIPRLFGQFVQLHTGVERRGGSGLGLAISKQIIEAHKGVIWVESEEGKGSAFVFTLPVKSWDETMSEVKE